MNQADISTLISLLRQEQAYEGFVGEPQEQVATLHEGLGRKLGKAIIDNATDTLDPEEIEELKVLKHLAGI